MVLRQNGAKSLTDFQWFKKSIATRINLWPKITYPNTIQAVCILLKGNGFICFN